jgi:peptidyl-prolyl cis-trans isomerase C
MAVRLTLAALALVLAVVGRPASAADDPVVAVVDGVKVHLSQVREMHRRLPAQYQQLPFETIFSGLVESVVDTKLAAADARRQKLQATKEFKEQMTRIEEQVLQRFAFEHAVKEVVTDAAVRARYDKIVKEVSGNEQIKASHILVKTEVDAAKIIEELGKGGDFAKLAKERSTDSSATGGGDLGFFGKGQMVPEFEKAAFALKDGEYNKKPLRTEFGWHVIKVDARRKAEVPKFEEAEEGLRNDLSQEAGVSYITKLREKAKITLFNADGSPLKEAKP